MDVHVIQDQSYLPISSESVSQLVKEFVKITKTKYDEVAIHFVDTATICALHKQFFDDPSVTDCISFPMDNDDDSGYRVMGDVFVCPKTAIDYVSIHGGDAYRETTLYLIHGLLHLLGYDDIEDEDREEMRKAEAKYLNHLDKQGLWLHA